MQEGKSVKDFKEGILRFPGWNAKRFLEAVVWIEWKEVTKSKSLKKKKTSSVKKVHNVVQKLWKQNTI